MKHFLEVITFLIAVSSRVHADQAPRIDLASLKHAAIDRNTITVSGLSSGGFMTSMMHYIFSSKIKGGAVFAGGPFNIAYNVTDRDLLPVYAINLVKALFGRSARDLQAQTESYANQGLIDPVANLKGSKSYVYQGGLDPVNPAFTGLSDKTVKNYKYFGSDVKYLQLPYGTHGVPTDNYGGLCAIFSIRYDGLNNCGVQSVFKMFSHFYGKNYVPAKSSTTPHTGTLYDFDQNRYAPSGNAASGFMNDYGGIYIPLACQDVKATCKLHVVFHGCYQTLYANFIYDVFAVHGGFLQAADANKIIVVFPRTAAFGIELEGTNGKTNLGCWDWFGLTSTTNVPFKEMPQVKSVSNILNAIIGTNLFA